MILAIIDHTLPVAATRKAMLEKFQRAEALFILPFHRRNRDRFRDLAGDPVPCCADGARHKRGCGRFPGGSITPKMQNNVNKTMA